MANQTRKRLREEGPTCGSGVTDNDGTTGSTKMPRKAESPELGLQDFDNSLPNKSEVPEQEHHLQASRYSSRPCIVFLIEKKISSGHLEHLKQVAKKKDFSISPAFSEEVTHIVTTLPTYDRVVSTLQCEVPFATEIVTLEWLTTSFIEGAPITVTDHYRLKSRLNLEEAVTSDGSATEAQVEHNHQQTSDYECQRITLLDHHNKVFSDALELLERYYFHVDYRQGDTRALAFRQAACALKALPRRIKHIDEVSSLHRIGRHSRQVIKDILADGCSSEVEDCRSSEWFQCMELFSSVYGCGSATADKWYHHGLRTIKEVCQCPEIKLTDIQELGLKYYDHLSQPVTREETEYIVSYIQSQAELCFSGTTVEAVGGYRRGKPHGHDVDILLSHPEISVTDVLLETLLARLRKMDVVIHADVTTGSNSLSHVQHSHVNASRPNYTQDGKQRRVKFDYLDKAFCILKLQPDQEPGQHQPQRNSTLSDALIRRVDLIVSPPEQYPFALVSWTGSKQFNRSLRRYAAKELNMSVTAHGIYDNVQKKFVPAVTEQEVFSALKLPYLEPLQRNC